MSLLCVPTSIGRKNAGPGLSNLDAPPSWKNINEAIKATGDEFQLSEQERNQRIHPA
jgi:hypothetical protein